MLTWPFPPGHFSKDAAPGQRRAIAVNVIVFFAFALAALVFLTKSAVAANAINRDVGAAIAPSTVGINKSTSALPALNSTMALTEKIAKATDPLAGHLGHVVTSTDNIDGNLSQIQGDVTEIGETVEEINSDVGQIRPEIFTLSEGVNGVHSKAGSISSSLAQVANDTDSMTRSLTGINASLASVLRDTKPLDVNVSGISKTINGVKGHTLSIANSPILLAAIPFPNIPVPDLLGLLGLGNIGLGDTSGGGRG